MKVRADGGEVVTKTEAGSHVHIKGGKQKREAASCHHGNTASLTDLECYNGIFGLPYENDLSLPYSQGLNVEFLYKHFGRPL